MKKLTAIDLFAGLGGTSEGLHQAGFEVLVAANHWPLAVELHKKNHPASSHYCQDLQQADFHSFPDFDLLAASPACQGHSIARGKDRPAHDITRSTAWAVVSCLEAKLPKFLMIENVPEFRGWPLYPLWKSCLETLGYLLTEVVLDAADFGVPQNRRRFFCIGVRSDLRDTPLPAPVGCSGHVAAETIIDERAASWSRVDRPGRSQATLARVGRGRVEQGGRFLFPYYGSGSGETGRSLARPVGTVTTRARWALADGDWMRMLTPREAARAQGFDDSYELPAVQKTAHHLVGNAVPPPLARAVAENFSRS